MKFITIYSYIILMELYSDFLKKRDLNYLSSSKFSIIYPSIFINYNLEPQTFLKFNLPLHYIRLIAQLRTSSKYCIKISLYNSCHIIDPQKVCQACGNNEVESLHHILISCPAYVSYRSQLFKNIPNYLNCPSPIV
jgi:hypothetical protein